MSHQGDTLFYPSSANSPFNPPHHHHHNNHQNQTAHNIQNNTIAVTMDSDEEKQHSSPSNGGGGKTGGKSRRELPTGAVATLKAWLLSPEHFTHPYPTPQDQIMLMQQTGIDKKQLKNWFTNARRRIWKPMLKKQLEAGKLAAATGGGGGGGTTATNNISIVPQPELPQQQPPQQEMYNNYQQAAQMQQQQGGGDDNDQQYQQTDYQQYDQNGGQVQYDQYGNQVYNQQNYQQQQQYQQQDGQQQQQQQGNDFPNCNSIGSLAPMNHAMSSIGSFGRMFKTDSHAVLMELFARDQDLVRQAAGKGGVVVSNNNSNNNNGATNAAAASGSGGGGLQASGPSGSNLRSPTSSNMGQRQHSVTFGGMGVNNNNNNNSSLSSWPHFSSVSSLNNLGGLQGVKSITNLSAADLSSMGNLNKMGNLAHVKSIEGNMGRGDSFAFLEVFFDDKSGLASSTHSSNSQRGVKREREDDDAIGLSLDGDDGTSPGQFNNNNGKPPAAADQEAPPPAPVESGVPKPAPLPEDGTDNNFDDSENGGGGTLKRAYDDALAARGLIAVRRSCEKLTDLDLPNKMQRTLSQEYIRQHNQGQPMGDFFSSNNSAYAPNNNANRQQQLMQPVSGGTDGGGMPSGTSVEVPSSTKCTLCTQVNVDTQLRPCGHMFHGRCLKPSLTGMSPPKCPICNVPMQSAILAVPSVATTADVDGLSSNLQVKAINKQD